MKVVHLCLGAFFPDNYSYQENMLPKFHKKMGYDVEVIASQETFDSNGNISYTDTTGSYQNEFGIKVTRLKYSFPEKLNHKMKSYIGVYDAIVESKPDIIFMHNCQFLSIFDVIKYLKKHPEVKLFVDNHVDFSNSAKNFLSRRILHGFIWKLCAKSINKYAEKFFGVLPARVDFLVNVYGLPKEKCELLVMGADDDLICEDDLLKYRDAKRKENEIENNMVIMTGGKIDNNKPQTISLMKAINGLDEENIRLLVFGSVIPELKAEFEAQLSEKVKFIGWKKSSELYAELSAADIVAFPGLHSVLWEQTVAMGKPCIFKKIAGFTHIDIGRNCLYFEKDSVEEYKKVIEKAILKLEELKQNAKKEEKNQFLYSNIARKSIGE
ncbi:MAG: glycosyltransferase family 4 protein [Clostridia bacterium]|nr:glycosyltransferase family 4 protein [Clostridia bacterium]